MSNPRIIIIGATSSMAEHCARLWLAQGPCELVLVGRDAGKLAIVASDLKVRCPAAVIQTLEGNFVDPHAITQLVDGIAASGAIDMALIAHGSLPEQAACQQDLALAQQAMVINGVSPVLFAEALVRHMQARNHGVLGIIGSVAGDRGRKSNYVYGAAKGLVTRYAQGLQHRLAGSKVKVVLIKPGPTDTPMTARLKARGAALASAQEVARTIVDGMAQGKPLLYAPAKWALVMMVIRHLPRFLFNKMDI